jgi:hypothetical protein
LFSVANGDASVFDGFVPLQINFGTVHAKFLEIGHVNFNCDLLVPHQRTGHAGRHTRLIGAVLAHLFLHFK